MVIGEMPEIWYCRNLKLVLNWL